MSDIIKKITDILDKNDLRLIVNSSENFCTLKIPAIRFPKSNKELLIRYIVNAEDVTIQHFSDGNYLNENVVPCIDYTRKTFILLSIIQISGMRSYPIQYIQFNLNDQKDLQMDDFYNKFIRESSEKELLLYQAVQGRCNQQEIVAGNIIDGYVFLQECFSSKK